MLELKGPHPDRTIRRLENGESEISGPIAIAVRSFLREAELALKELERKRK